MKVWQIFQSIIFVIFCTIGIAYFLAQLSVIGVTQVAHQAEQAHLSNDARIADLYERVAQLRKGQTTMQDEIDRLKK